MLHPLFCRYCRYYCFSTEIVCSRVRKLVECKLVERKLVEENWSIRKLVIQTSSRECYDEKRKIAKITVSLLIIKLINEKRNKHKTITKLTSIMKKGASFFEVWELI